MRRCFAILVASLCLATAACANYPDGIREAMPSSHGPRGAPFAGPPVYMHGDKGTDILVAHHESHVIADCRDGNGAEIIFAQPTSRVEAFCRTAKVYYETDERVLGVEVTTGNGARSFECPIGTAFGPVPWDTSKCIETTAKTTPKPSRSSWGPFGEFFDLP